MMNKNIVWIMALLMVVLSCKGRQNGANAQVADALYATEKAKTVRMYEIPAPLKDRNRFCIVKAIPPHIISRQRRPIGWLGT